MHAKLEKWRTGVLTLAVAIGTTLLTTNSEAVHPASFDPTALLATCSLLGGVYYPPDPAFGGSFGCELPDHSVIWCDANGSCIVTADRQVATVQELWPRIELITRQLASFVLQGPADLVPLPAPAATGPDAFCRRNEQGQLLVDVRNQGVGAAAVSKTRVIFAGSSPVDIATPTLNAGTGTTLVADIPNTCFDANLKCSFSIGVDAEQAIAEGNETNNNASGVCGPQVL